jgi:hypothetical protein
LAHDLAEPLRVVLRIAAHRAVGLDVGDQQTHRAVALGLQGENAVVFERAGEQHREGDSFAEQVATGSG